MVFAILLLTCQFLKASELKAGISINDLDRSIAQKLILDIRYYCSNAVKGKEFASDGRCFKPITRLPLALNHLIRDTGVGGIILFSENIKSVHQVKKLTNALQNAAKLSKQKKPLFIAIDQEGGRVVRLPRQFGTSFSGNMAIGATYSKYGNHYAQVVGSVIGKELAALGFNLNFSPNIDINNNPRNPVINVRSFGEKPEIVSDLGITMLNAIQEQGVISTLKHFPGHGNTSVDSHTGLPRVNRDSHLLFETELVPFQNAISQSKPGMIMTAHIQYPKLDSSKIETKMNSMIIKPATMSSHLIENILRKQLGFDGVVITDALNMESITNNFSVENAVVKTFMAGTDIALMPFQIRKPEDIESFKLFLKNLAKRLTKTGNSRRRLDASLERINKLRRHYNLEHFPSQKQQHKKRLTRQQGIKHRAEETKLSMDAITVIKNQNSILPLSQNKYRKIHFIVEGQPHENVIRNAIENHWPKKNNGQPQLSFSQLGQQNDEQSKTAIADSNIIVLVQSHPKFGEIVQGESLKYASHLSKTASNNGRPNKKINSENYHKRIIDKLLEYASLNNKKQIVIGMQSPYEIGRYINKVNAALLAYDSSIYRDPITKQLVGKGFSAAIAILVGAEQANGMLPVSMNSSGR